MTEAKKSQTESSGKIGVLSDQQPDLVPPSGVNQRDHGVADDKPMAGGALNLDDDELAHPRGNVTRSGGTWDDKTASDAGDLGTPDVGMSDHNGPSDRGTRRNG